MTTTFVKFSGDTLINSNHFKKVLVSNDSLQSNYVLAGYIHEDSTNKVFFRYLDSTIRLLYDFNVKVGDSIDIGLYTPIYLVVDTIDSVFIYNKHLKRFILSYYGWSGEQWIEGIGSLCGVLNSGNYFVVGTKHELLCYYENDTLKYSNPNYANCYYNTVGIDNFESGRTRVNLFPNPVTSTSILSIENKHNKDYLIEIYNVKGVNIKTFVIINDKLFIHKNDFVPGFYFYRLIAPETDIITGKFIIK